MVWDETKLSAQINGNKMKLRATVGSKDGQTLKLKQENLKTFPLGTTLKKYYSPTIKIVNTDEADCSIVLNPPNDVVNEDQNQ